MSRHGNGDWIWSKIKLTFLVMPFIIVFMACISVSNAATMNDYCNQPPFLSTSVKPNVLIVMDFSGSMSWNAYSGSYNAGNNYYGYFKNDKYYKYLSNRFQVNASCTDTNKIGSSNNCISGNLLNWITSTRVDIARKVLTGGRTSTGASDRMESEGDERTYTDSSLHCRFEIAMSGGTRTLSISSTGGTCPIASLSGSAIKVDAENVSEITGIAHDFYDKVFFEFMVFGGSTRKGEIRSGKDATLSSLIAAINTESPNSNTPTGEALWEAYDYFKQSNDHSYEANTSDINSGNGNKDPWYDGSGASSTAIPCRKAFVLLLSDGSWNGSVDPVTPAREMLINDLRTAAALPGKQNVTTYTVYAFGAGDVQGRQAMITTAIFGGFDDNDSNTWPYTFTSTPSSSLTVTYPRTQCNPSGTWNSQCSEWDKSGTGLPYNFFEADDGDVLKSALTSALNDMLRRASSGTAVSVLASSEGSGANLIQAVFYPKRQFNNNTEVDWTSEMQNLWYYLDPYLANANIREDTTVDKKLNLSNDYIIEFFFDTNDNKTKARRYSDSDGDGDADTLVDTVPLDSIKNLWEAGELLWSRTSARNIYTYDVTGTYASKLMPFSTGNESFLRAYIQAADSTEGNKIINYVHGTDQTGYRSRTVTIGAASKVWKLGDIINSTPRLQSNVRLNSYNLDSPNGYGDTTYSSYINTTSYKTRGMAYVGANDGMLHAFKLGTLDVTQSGAQKATLCEDTDPVGGDGKCSAGETTTANLGKEEWTFIPKNALPYLKYMADTGYCHLYYVDGVPYVFDASIEIDNDTNDDGSPDQPVECTGSEYWKCVKSKDSWKTIVIGSMGLGGACRDLGASCSDCVKNPISGVGYSSYFALDVTDPLNPKLLWEFTDAALGYSTSGPAVIRIGDTDKNGRWFAVFASGPTGPIDTANHQFLGKSDQNLKLFVVDLKTGTLLRTIDTGVLYAFGGSLFNSPLDVDKWNPASSGYYKDDVLYFGYTKKTGTTWTDGGVLRLMTKEDVDPAQWAVSTVIDGIGPVTAAIAKLQDRNNHKLWLHFGTGRYFYKTPTDIDDADNQRKIFGIKEPCYNKNSIGDDVDNTCTDTITLGSLDNRTSSPSSSEPTYGWYINLDASTSSYKAERLITDPLAAFTGTVYYTTFSPSNDVCGYGGNTYLWAVTYRAGASSTGQQGRAMLQVSTGSIEEKSLSTSFTEKEGRRTASMKGTPPKGQGLAIVIKPKPMNKILHIKEK